MELAGRGRYHSSVEKLHIWHGLEDTLIGWTHKSGLYFDGLVGTHLFVHLENFFKDERRL